jgi:catechol 2,3-dioxygenase-like lactoylglutathione lyase family enzyme
LYPEIGRRPAAPWRTIGAAETKKADFTAMPISIEALDHLVVNCTDAVRSAAWYAQVLGMEVRSFDPGGGRAARTSLHFGRQKINLRPVATAKDEWFTADNESAGSDDLCFLTTASPQAVVAHLQACGVAIELGPVTREGARGTLHSVYCRDPDGSLIEISSY